MYYKNIFWATDIHLDFVLSQEAEKFFTHAGKADVLIISGDIGNGKKQYFEMLSDELPNTQICFVLGNHDYYGRSFDEMNGIIQRLCNKRHNLNWLSTLPNKYVNINDVALLGHEGWYDCHYGKTGHVVLNDFLSIKDIRKGYLSGVEQLMINVFREAATRSADHFKLALESAFQTHDRAILVTHVPPFTEAAWYKGKVCEDAWLPFMTSKISGDAIINVMNTYKDKDLLVLCGHTHGAGEAQILPNLKVLTGHSLYKFPEIQKEMGDLSV